MFCPLRVRVFLVFFRPWGLGSGSSFCFKVLMLTKKSDMNLVCPFGLLQAGLCKALNTWDTLNSKHLKSESPVQS